ncbi:MAG: Dynein heavy chain 1, axonemal, partial [Paramarteilia canceri]
TYNDDMKAYWNLVEVTDYDKIKKIYTVVKTKLDSEKIFESQEALKISFKVPRIFLRFLSENPNTYIERLKYALNSRNISRALDIIWTNIEYYEKYIDENMNLNYYLPKRDSKDKAQARFDSIYSHLKTSDKQLLRNIYAIKIMERKPFIFYQASEELGTSPKFRINFESDTNCSMNNSIYNNTIQQSFLKAKITCSKILLISYPPVITAIEIMNSAVQELENIAILPEKLKFPVSIDEFSKTILNYHEKIDSYIKEKWHPQIVMNLQKSFSMEKKGWFNVNVCDWDAYQLSKLKNLMRKFRYMIESTFQTIITQFMHKMNDLFCQKNSQQKKPVIAVLVQTKKGQIKLNESFERISDVLKNIFVQCFSTFSEIPNIEKSVLTNLAINGAQYYHLSIINIDEMNLMISNILSNIEIDWLKMNKGLEKFKIYENCFELRPEIESEEYLANNELNKTIIDEKLTQIKKNILSLSSEIDSFECFGLFSMNLENFKQNLIKNEKGSIAKNLDETYKKLYHESEKIAILYSEILKNLSKIPTSVEEWFEKTKWIQSIPSIIEKNQKLNMALLENYEILEDNDYYLSQKSLETKWISLSLQIKIKDEILNSQNNLKISRDELIKKHSSDLTHFSEKLDSIKMLVSGLSAYTDIEKAQETFQETERINGIIESLKNEAIIFSQREEKLNLPNRISSITPILKIAENAEPFVIVWRNVSQWKINSKKWLESRINEIKWTNSSSFDIYFQEMIDNLNYSIENLKDHPLVLGIGDSVLMEVKQTKEYKIFIEIFNFPGLRIRHYKMMNQFQDKINFKVNEKICLKELIKNEMINYIENFEEILEISKQEFKIEQNLQSISNFWSNQSFNLKIQESNNDAPFMVNLTQELILKLNSDTFSCQSMKTSKYCQPFLKSIEDLQHRLLSAEEVLGIWIQVQKNWQTIYPFFSSDKFSKQLPAENQKFKIMDKIYRFIMKRTEDVPNIIDYCSDSGDISLRKNLGDCQRLLGEILESLKEYLNTLRHSVNKLYYLTDREVFELFSLEKDLNKIKKSIKKLFRSIGGIVEMKDDCNNLVKGNIIIGAIKTNDGEKIQMHPPINSNARFEVWIPNIEINLENYLKNRYLSIKNIEDNYDIIDIFRKELPIQIIDLYLRIKSKKVISRAICNNKLENIFEMANKDIETLKKLLQSSLDMPQKDTIYNSLVYKIEERDLIKVMIDKKVKDEKNFIWFSYFKYDTTTNLAKNEESIVDIQVEVLGNSYEYLWKLISPYKRLLITSQSNKHKVSIASVINGRRCAVLSGSNGVDKFELANDVAKSFGAQCNMISCSKNIPLLHILRMIKACDVINQSRNEKTKINIFRHMPHIDNGSSYDQSLSSLLFEINNKSIENEDAENWLVINPLDEAKYLEYVKKDQNKKYVVGSSLAYSLCWTFGASLNRQKKIDLSEIVKSVLGEEYTTDIKNYFDKNLEINSFENVKLLFHVYLIKIWTESFHKDLKSFSESDFSFEEVIFSYAELFKIMSIIDRIHLVNKFENILIIGPKFSGKSSICNYLWNRMINNNDEVFYFDSNSSLNSKNLRSLLFNMLEKSSLDTIKPNNNKILTILIDNFVPLSLESERLESLVQTVSQIFETNGLYDHNGFFIKIENVRFIITVDESHLKFCSKILKETFIISLQGLSIEEQLDLLKSYTLKKISIAEIVDSESYLEKLAQAIFNIHDEITSTKDELDIKFEFSDDHIFQLVADFDLYDTKNITDKNRLTSLFFEVIKKSYTNKFLDTRTKTNISEIVTNTYQKYFTEFQGKPSKQITYSRLNKNSIIFEKMQPIDSLIELKNLISIAINNAQIEPPNDLITSSSEFNYNFNSVYNIVTSKCKYFSILGGNNFGLEFMVKTCCKIINYKFIAVGNYLKDKEDSLLEAFKQTINSLITSEYEYLLYIDDKMLTKKRFKNYLENLITNTNIIFLYDHDELVELELKNKKNNPNYQNLSFLEWIEIANNKLKYSLKILLSFNSREMVEKFIKIGDNKLRNYFIPYAFKKLSLESLVSISESIFSDENQFSKSEFDKLFPGSSLSSCLAAVYRFISNDIDSNKSMNNEIIYINFVKLFISILSNESKEQNQKISDLDLVLNSINRIEILVEDLENKVCNIELEYDEIINNIGNIIEKISKDKEKAEVARNEILKGNSLIETKLESIKKVKKEEQKNLKIATTELNLALESIQKLDKSDIIEIKTLKRPPSGVKLVVEAINILLKNDSNETIISEKTSDYKNDFTDIIRNLVQDPQKFLENLINFNKDKISDRAISILNKYVKKPEFEPKVISKISKACTSLCEWVRAIVKYDELSKQISPKKLQIKELEKELNGTKEQHSKAEDKLSQINDDISMFESELEEQKKKKIHLENELRNSRKTLKLSQEVIHR